MSCRSGMFCYTCDIQLPKPNHFAFSDDGEILVMCDDCFEDISRFYVKGVNASGARSRGLNKGDEQEV